MCLGVLDHRHRFSPKALHLNLPSSRDALFCITHTYTYACVYVPAGCGPGAGPDRLGPQGRAGRGGGGQPRGPSCPRGSTTGDACLPAFLWWRALTQVMM